MTLHSRLNDELLGDNPYVPRDMTAEQRTTLRAVTKLLELRRQKVPGVAERIAQDLLALIGEDERLGGTTINQMLADAQNNLRREFRTAIRQYCGIREGSDD